MWIFEFTIQPEKIQRRWEFKDSVNEKLLCNLTNCKEVHEVTFVFYWAGGWSAQSFTTAFPCPDLQQYRPLTVSHPLHHFLHLCFSGHHPGLSQQGIRGKVLLKATPVKLHRKLFHNFRLSTWLYLSVYFIGVLHRIQGYFTYTLIHLYTKLIGC